MSATQQGSVGDFSSYAEGVKLPTYDGLYIVVKKVRFNAFYHNLRATNPTILIDRPRAEVCWYLLLKKLYKKASK
jgi:hypothetical protein